MNNKQKLRPCLFLDRDGIINEDVGYAYQVEQIRFVPGIFSICRYFQRRGYLIAIVTNQSGIAREFYTEEDFANLSQWMEAEFHKRQIHISSIKHCPHHPKITGKCSCRKPEPGMLLEAANEIGIDLNNSVMIGDKLSDMQAGLAAGVKANIWLSSEDVLYHRKAPYNCLTIRNLLQLRALLGL